MAAPSPDFPETLHRLQRAGLLRGLAPELAARFEKSPPNAETIAQLLHAYYGAEGDSVEALWRRQHDRYVDIEVEAPPELALRAVQHALPVLEGLHCRLTAHTMEVATDTDGVTVSRVVQETTHPAVARRVPVTSPRHVVGAVNELLSRVGHRCRFIPLRHVEARQAYVAAAIREAKLLQRLGIAAVRDIDEMLRFSGWDHAGPLRSRPPGS